MARRLLSLLFSVSLRLPKPPSFRPTAPVGSPVLRKPPAVGPSGLQPNGATNTTRYTPILLLFTDRGASCPEDGAVFLERVLRT